MEIGDVITVDKDVLSGTPVFKGTRVPIKNLFDYLCAGDSLNDFLGDFDHISKESCLAVLTAAEELITGRKIEKALTKK